MGTGLIPVLVRYNMRWLDCFYKSLYNFSWLKSQRNNRRDAWKYFFLLMIILTLVAVVPVFVGLPKAIGELKTKAKDLPEFKATLNAGTLAVTDLKQPFVFKDDENFVIVIDTESAAAPSLNNFLAEGQSGILFSKEKVELFDNASGQSKEQSLKGMPNFAMGKTELVNNVDKYTGVKFLIIFDVVFLLVIFAVNFFTKLIGLLIALLIVLLAVKIAGKEWKFDELFNVGLYAVTLPILLGFALNLIGFTISVYFLAVLAFLLALVFTKDDSIVIAS